MTARHRHAVLLQHAASRDPSMEVQPLQMAAVPVVSHALMRQRHDGHARGQGGRVGQRSGAAAHGPVQWGSAVGVRGRGV